jgi:hypothetical protein
MKRRLGQYGLKRQFIKNRPKGAFIPMKVEFNPHSKEVHGTQRS